MKKKKIKEEELNQTDPNVSQQEAQAYSEYVAIKKAERKVELKKEKQAEKLIDSRAGGFVNNFSGNSNNYGFGMESYGEESGSTLFSTSPPDGVKALKGLPKVKKKAYTGRANVSKPTYYLDAPPPAPYMEPSAKIEVEYSGETLPDLESVDAKLPSEVEMFSQVREDIRIFRTGDSTMICAIIVDKQESNNRAVAIRCYGGVAFGGYVRDCSGDAYLIEGVDYVHLGTIPFSFRIEIPKAGNWGVNIPISEKVLMSSFAPSQLKAISDLRERYPEDKFDINYLQMLLAN